MKTNTYTKRKLPKYNFGSFIKDTGRRIADNSLSVVGAGNVINEDNYETKFFKKLDPIADGMYATSGQVAANILAPGSGQLVGGMQDSVGGMVGNPVQERKNEEQMRINRITQKNMQLTNNMPTFPDGGSLGKDSTLNNRSIKGVLVEGLTKRHNETKSKREKNYYRSLRNHITKQNLEGLEGREEFNTYANDPMLNQYITDPTTLGFLKERGFDMLDIASPNKQVTGQVLANGGSIINYDGADHEGGGIPVEAVNGMPVPREMADGEVEDGEVSVSFPKEETAYIFSERLGFADKAKKIQTKYGKRENDSISKKAMFEELSRLRNEQETYKQEMQGILDKHKYGGRMKYASGGTLPKYWDGSTLEKLGYGSLDPVKEPIYKNLNTNPANTNTLMGSANDSYMYNDNVDIASNVNTDSPYRGSLAPATINIAGNVAGMISADKALSRARKSYRPSAEYSPEQVDLSQARTRIEESGRDRINMLKSNIKNLSPGQRSAVLASYSDADLMKELRETYLNENLSNVDIRNKARLYNLEMKKREREKLAELEEFYRQEKKQHLGNITGTITETSSQRQKYDLSNALSDNYTMINDPNSSAIDRYLGRSLKYKTKR